MPCMLARDGIAHVCRCEEERFFAKVEVRGDCWIWTATIHKATGYGKFGYTPGAPHGRKTVSAHVWSWEFFRGERYGLNLDHLCHGADSACPGGLACLHRLCVNPDHLDLTTQKVNIHRGQSPAAWKRLRTECAFGHPFDAKNTIWEAGSRKCRTCRQGRERSRYAEKVARQKVVA